MKRKTETGKRSRLKKWQCLLKIFSDPLINVNSYISPMKLRKLLALKNEAGIFVMCQFQCRTLVRAFRMTEIWVKFRSVLPFLTSESVTVNLCGIAEMLLFIAVLSKTDSSQIMRLLIILPLLIGLLGQLTTVGLLTALT